MVKEISNFTFDKKGALTLYDEANNKIGVIERRDDSGNKDLWVSCIVGLLEAIYEGTYRLSPNYNGKVSAEYNMFRCAYIKALTYEVTFEKLRESFGRKLSVVLEELGATLPQFVKMFGVSLKFLEQEGIRQSVISFGGKLPYTKFSDVHGLDNNKFYLSTRSVLRYSHVRQDYLPTSHLEEFSLHTKLAYELFEGDLRLVPLQQSILDLAYLLPKVKDEFKYIGVHKVIRAKPHVGMFEERVRIKNGVLEVFNA